MVVRRGGEGGGGVELGRSVPQASQQRWLAELIRVQMSQVQDLGLDLVVCDDGDEVVVRSMSGGCEVGLEEEEEEDIVGGDCGCCEGDVVVAVLLPAPWLPAGLSLLVGR